MRVILICSASGSRQILMVPNVVHTMAAFVVLIVSIYIVLQTAVLTMSAFVVLIVFVVRIHRLASDHCIIPEP